MQTILVVREFDNFSRILSENDFPVVNCPTIKVVELENSNDFEQKMAALDSFDGVFLTSYNATKVFRRKLDATKNIFEGKVYILGKRSFDVLKNSALDIFFDESANTAVEMLDKIPSEDLESKRFLFVRGDNSLNVVADFLKNKATLEETVVYKTEKREIEIDELQNLRSSIEKGEICCTCFFSPSAAESFIEQFGAEVLHQTVIATIGKTTAKYFECQNLPVKLVSSKSNAKSFATELIRYLKNEKRET